MLKVVEGGKESGVQGGAATFWCIIKRLPLWAITISIPFIRISSDWTMVLTKNNYIKKKSVQSSKTGIC